MNRLACALAILVIRGYQRFGRRLVRRRCLYAPTCSQRSIEFFRGGRFLPAWRATRLQLARCHGDYSLRLNPRQEVELVTPAGAVVLERELAPWLVQRIRAFLPPPAKGTGVGPPEPGG